MAPVTAAAPAAVPSRPVDERRRPGGVATLKELAFQPMTDMAVPYLVKSILSEHDMGQFQRSSLLWEQMRRDDRIKAVVSVRINALLGLETSVTAAEDEKPTEATLSRLKRTWASVASHAEKQQIISWALGTGVAYGRLEWVATIQKGGGAWEWTPRLDVWHPCFLSWRESERAFFVNTANQSQVRVTPGENGWWLYAPFGLKRGWAEGFVHALAMPWLARQWAYRDWARYNEIHGLPMVKAFIPLGAQEDDVTRYAAELANRASSPVVLLPQDAQGNKFDFELVEAKADTWQAFQGMKGDANVDIAVSVLGQNLTTEVQGGSLAASKVQDKVRADILLSDARAFEEFAERQILSPWAECNVAAGAGVTFELRFQSEEVADLAAVGDGLTKVGEGIQAMKAAGVQLDVDEVTKRADIPTSGPAEEPAPPPAPVLPTPGTPRGGTGERLQVVASLDALPTAEKTQLQGQAYADAIVEALTKEGTRHMDADRLRILGIIHQAESLEQMRTLLESAYSEMDPTAFAEIMQVALMEAELNGLWSARGM